MTKIGLKGQNDQNCRIDPNMLNGRDDKRAEVANLLRIAKTAKMIRKFKRGHKGQNDQNGTRV